MRQLKLFRWAAALTLAIALAPGAASAQEADTLTISSTFTMDSLSGTVGPDLAEVYANGDEHTWTLTLHSTTHSHHRLDTLTYRTTIHATSFDFEFFGPDAATLNGIVSEHIAGGDVLLRLWNGYGVGLGTWEVWVGGPDVWFWTGELENGWNTLFPSNADGYPVVGPEPFSIWAESHILSDGRPGNAGWIESFPLEPLVTFAVIPISSPLPGDFNGDNVVDAADYTVWRDRLGQTASLPNDDTPGVGPDDYTRWVEHFGITAPELGAGSGAALPSAALLSPAVPEPACVALAAMGVLGLFFRVRRANPAAAGRVSPGGPKIVPISCVACPDSPIIMKATGSCLRGTTY